MKRNFFKCHENIISIIFVLISLPFLLVFWKDNVDEIDKAGALAFICYIGGTGCLSITDSLIRILAKRLWLGELQAKSEVEVIKTISKESCMIKLANGKIYKLYTYSWCPQYFPGKYRVSADENRLEKI